MKCPVCKTYEQAYIHLHSVGFDEALSTCHICGAEWSVNHGLCEVVSDPLENSFLAALSECVEADDYSYAA